MTREKIVQLIEKRKEELRKPYKKSSGYDFCKQYVLDNPVKDITDIVNIDIWTLLKCMYYINGSSKSIKEISDIFDSFRGFFECAHPDDIFTFVETTELIGDRVETEDENSKGFNVVEYAYHLAEQIVNKDNSLVSPKIIEEMTGFESKEINLTNYFKCYQEQHKAFIRLMGDYIVYRKMLTLNKYLNRNADKENYNNKERKLYKKNEIEKSCNYKKILSEINSVKYYIESEDKKEEKERRKNNKEIYNLESALKALDVALKNQEIRNASEIVKQVADLDIKYAMLQLIAEHNNKYYDELNSEFETLNNNDKIKYRSLLDKYNIPKNICNIESIMVNSIEEVDLMLKSLTKFEFTNEQIIRILKYSNLEIVSKIKEYSDKEYIGLDFICSNIDLFYEASSKLSLYENSLNIINNYGINPSVFKDYSQLLLNSDLLDKNLNILDSYNLLSSIRTTNSYEFIANDDLASLIDKYIELGYMEYLVKDLNLLNTDKLLRLELLQKLGLGIESKEELESILEKKRFFVEDSEILNYLPREVASIDNFRDISLASYREDYLTYNIDGVLVSAPKVDRLISEGYSKHDAIFYGMHLREEEYREVINNINGTPYKK